LDDQPRSGRPCRVDEAQVAVRTLEPPPDKLGVTAPILPLRPGLPCTCDFSSRHACRSGATHDYVRHGTTTLFAALEVATGKVTDACFKRHRHQEFLRFLNRGPKPTRAASCISCWTTTAPTSTPRCATG
jgi:hypothetical protein